MPDATIPVFKPWGIQFPQSVPNWGPTYGYLAGARREPWSSDLPSSMFGGYFQVQILPTYVPLPPPPTVIRKMNIFVAPAHDFTIPSQPFEVQNQVIIPGGFVSRRPVWKYDFGRRAK